MDAVITGDDHDGLADALTDAGVDTRRVTGVISTEKLVDAGIDDADLFVLTDLEEATAIPLAVERNPDVRVVVYSRSSLPEFVRGQVDLAVDPALLDASVVAAELSADAGSD